MNLNAQHGDVSSVGQRERERATAHITKIDQFGTVPHKALPDEYLKS